MRFIEINSPLHLDNACKMEAVTSMHCSIKKYCFNAFSMSRSEDACKMNLITLQRQDHSVDKRDKSVIATARKLFLQIKMRICV